MDGNTYERVKQNYSKLEDYSQLKENIVMEKRTYRFIKRTVDKMCIRDRCSCRSRNFNFL